MALTSWSLSNWLLRNAVVITTYPFALDGWAYVHTAGFWAMALAVTGDTGTSDYRGQTSVFNTNVVNAAVIASSSTDSANSSTAYNLDTWFYWTGAFVSNVLRRAYLNAGGGGNPGTTDLTPAAADRFEIGRYGDNTGGFDSGGALGEIAVWNLGSMTQTEQESLFAKRYNGSGSTGQNPLAINAEAGQPWTGALVAYWRLTDTNDLSDLANNGHTLTMQGTLTNWGGTAPPVDPVPGAPGGSASHILAYKVT